MPKLRLSLTIPGAVSLGAYEGGALAALVVAVRALGEENVVIDTIASASAGSITALLTAKALLRGGNPTDLMKAAWVENVSFAAMKTRSTQSLLSSDALTAMASKVLGPDGIPDGPPGTPVQHEPIALSMAIASLAGLTYRIPRLERDTPVEGSTYLDFYNATLTNGDGAAVYLQHAEGAIASGSNALGFPPKRLNRKALEAQYDDAGLEGFPTDGEFWYTDGGTVDNEPLGRTIDLANGISSDDPRLFVLIHPNQGASSPVNAGVWGGDAPVPPWVRTATHADSMGRVQTIYDDLRTLEKTNSHLVWADTIGPAVRQGLENGLAGSTLTETEREAVRTQVAVALSAALSDVRRQQGELEASAQRVHKDHGDAEGDYADLIGQLVAAATGLEGRRPARVEIVSPALGASPGESPATLLAGAFLFHFGGFIDIAFRQSDFALGYRNMTYWLEHDLASYLPGVDLQAAQDAVRQAYEALGWDGIRKGGATLSGLSFGEKVGLGKLGVHLAHVVLHDLRTHGV